MEKLLFKTVQCKGYLQKQETKHIYYSTIEDEYIEDDFSITLNQGGSCEQDILKFVEKPFEGICVGIFFKNIKREYIDCIDDISGNQFLHIKSKDPIKVAKVFYGNNKSRLVPLDKVEIWQAPF